MNYLLRDISGTDVYKSILKDEKYPVKISGLVFASKSTLVSSYVRDRNKPAIIITYNEVQAKRLLKDLSYFNEEVLFFPKKEIAIYDYDVESNELDFDRYEILNKIYNKKARIIVTTIEAVMQSMVSKETFYNNIIKIKDNQKIDLEELKQKLIYMGYERVDLVEARGQFSVRGNIIDISNTTSRGIRIETWGDEVDSVREFSIASQRSTERLKNVEIYPTREAILEDTIDNICSKILNTGKKDALKDIEIIKEGNYSSKIDKYFNEFYTKQSNLLDYTEEFEIFVDEEEKVKQRIKAIQNDNENLIKELLSREKQIPDLLENINKYKFNLNQIIAITENDSKINEFNLREITLLNGEIDSLRKDIERARKKKQKIVILAGNRENQNKICKLIDNPIKVENLDNIIIKPGQVIISEGAISSGYENKDTGLIVLSSEEFFSQARRKKKIIENSTFKDSEKIVFADLKVGDYIVHKNYGIGIFTGVKTITVDSITKDFIGIKYRNEDSLYVPTDSLDNVRKYIGGEEGIRLNRLGTKEWQDTKAKVKGNLRQVAKELIELYAKRENSKGYSFSKDTPWQKEFEDNFPYKETGDQERCIQEVKSDMEKQKPMDRLLCGDVGYGKTEVAMRATFKAVMDSKQVCYLAPTTILANQQYLEFKERMKNYPIKIELLCRFVSQAEQRKIVKRLKDGDVDIVIGTHRVLSKDIEFKNLGLLIIDEEHRFGVKAKEKIKQYKANVDVLTMTATPIPRTMQMSIVGIRDMSVIYDPPQNRKPIQTYVLEYDKEIIKEAITREIERNGQVFYIYNNVENISKKALEISKLVPEAKVSYAHGQMSGTQIEEIMEAFVNKESNVLVCTTILESGIDIPNANTMIVENADRFGLAQLYQIRGRVGRSDKQAYAYITYRKDKIISEDASQRLKAIKEFTEFGSGFKIATRDLQIRGAGSLFGEIQHGHIEQVGYDMYNKLLEEVVKEEKGIKVEEEQDITIDINISAFIPESYIENSSQKIEIYQDIANCRTEEDIQNVIEEIIDRYGNMPKEVISLIDIARIKNIAREKNIIKIQSKPNGIMFLFSKFDFSKLDTIMDYYRNNIYFPSQEKPYLTIKTKNDDINEIYNFLKLL